MPHITEDERTFEIITNELRLAVNPDNVLARLYLLIAQHNLPQHLVAGMIGVSTVTLRAWSKNCPTLVGKHHYNVSSFIQWARMVVSANLNLRAALQARPELGEWCAEGDNTRPTLGE